MSLGRCAGGWLRRCAEAVLLAAGLIITVCVAACSSSAPVTSHGTGGNPAATPVGTGSGQGTSASGQLISITLTPIVAAGPGDLAAAARLVTQRAARLGLQHTDAVVAGQDVVVTGPKADEARLEALAVRGVLRMRQVLLEGSASSGAAGTAAGDPGLVRPEVLKLFDKLECARSADPSGWKTQAGYTSSADWDVAGQQIVSCDATTGTKYVLDVAKVQGEEVTSASAQLSATDGQWMVLLDFNSEGTAAFGSLTTDLYGRYYASAATDPNAQALDQVAIVLDGNVISAPEIQQPIMGGQAQITGSFTRSAAQQLAADLQGGSLPADFRVSSVSALAPAESG
jgi:SecDF, P1 head subdomain